jgi:hypothetical protein
LLELLQIVFATGQHRHLKALGAETPYKGLAIARPNTHNNTYLVHLLSLPPVTPASLSGTGQSRVEGQGAPQGAQAVSSLWLNAVSTLPCPELNAKVGLFK